MNLKNKSTGFTLVEIAIVLVIVGLLLGGGINLLSATTDVARYKESQNNLNEVKETLLSYYNQYKVLPCPDTDNDRTNTATFGTENFVLSGATPSIKTCVNNQGWLPHATLGIGGNGDAWGERIKYVVNGSFVDVNGISTNFCPSVASATTIPYSRDVGVGKPATQIIILNLPIPPATVQTLAGNWAAFALVATNKNGRQTNAGNNPTAFDNAAACGGLAALEQENCNNDAANDSAADTDSIIDIALTSGVQMSDGSAVTFDDSVVWVGDMQLISELRKSGACN